MEKKWVKTRQRTKSSGNGTLENDFNKQKGADGRAINKNNNKTLKLAWLRNKFWYTNVHLYMLNVYLYISIYIYIYRYISFDFSSTPKGTTIVLIPPGSLLLLKLTYNYNHTYLHKCFEHVRPFFETQFTCSFIELLILWQLWHSCSVIAAPTDNLTQQVLRCCALASLCQAFI